MPVRIEDIPSFDDLPDDERNARFAVPEHHPHGPARAITFDDLFRTLARDQRHRMAGS